MSNATAEKNVCLYLSVDDDSFDFATSIDDALEQTKAELVALQETAESIHNLRPECDKVDYILAVSSGALCSVVDIFLVGKPGESPLGDLTDKSFERVTMDFAKMCDPKHKEFESHEEALKSLEKIFKVPYDQTGKGEAGRKTFVLTPKNHHFKSLAHNPSLLGLFFSILDQFQNTSHFISDGKLLTLQKADEKWELRGNNIPSKLFCGFVNWLGHLISDMSGSSSSAKKGGRGMGIPSPLWTWINDIIAIKDKLGLKATETDKAINEMALAIFEKGYDTRFQTAQAIPVLLNELIVRLIYSVRRLFRYFSETSTENRSFKLMWQKCEPFSNPTVKRMLTVAHGTFCLIDTGDAVGRAIARGGGFNLGEFVFRLNVVGVGRLTISLYGEANRAFSYAHVQQEADFASREITIVENYLEGLKILSVKYDDARLLTFIDDFKKSEAYVEAFEKSTQLAELRDVPPDRILKSKSDIDRYFGGN